MFTVIRFSHSYLESLKLASLEDKEWGLSFVCSDKNKIGTNTVGTDVGLPG